jgi:hypothetical protein
MALAKESSVVFSVKQLLDAETERLDLEAAAREERLAEEREQQRMAREAEREQEQQRAEQVRQEQRRLQLLHEAEILKMRLAAETETAMARVQSEQQHEAQLASLQRDARVASLIGRQRILVATLATLVVGGILCWSLVIAPGQRRANNAYIQQRESYSALLDEASKREVELRREQRLIKEKLESILMAFPAVQPGIAPVNPVPLPTKKTPRRPPDNGKHSCECLPTDPLCDCGK